MALRRLNIRQSLFIHEYLVDLDGKNAAIRAGFAPASAKQRASCLLRRPDIAAEIQRAMDARAARLGITPERIIEEYARIAFADMRLLVDWDDDGVRLKQAGAIADEAAASLASIASLGPSQSRCGRVQWGTFDKQRALDSLALILGFDPGVGARRDTGRVH